MFCIFVIPDYLNAEDYTVIQSVDEIRPFELLKINEKFNQSVESISVLLKEISKINPINKKDLFKKYISAFVLDNKKYSFKNFNDLLKFIENQTNQIQNELDNMLKPIEIQYENDENFMFLDYFYCSVSMEQSKNFEKIFNTKTIIKIDQTESKMFYKIYCLKSERSEIESFILDKFGKSISIEKSKVLKLEIDNTIVAKLKDQCIENLLISVIYNGLVESLDKCGIDSYKYKFLLQSKAEKEIKNLKKMNNDCDMNEILTMINFDGLE